jgi:hypothetical protein
MFVEKLPNARCAAVGRIIMAAFPILLSSASAKPAISRLMRQE